MLGNTLSDRKFNCSLTDFCDISTTKSICRFSQDRYIKAVFNRSFTKISLKKKKNVKKNVKKTNNITNLNDKDINLQNAHTRGFIRKRNKYQFVETPRTHDGGIDNVRTIGCSNNEHLEEKMNQKIIIITNKPNKFTWPQFQSPTQLPQKK